MRDIIPHKSGIDLFGAICAAKHSLYLIIGTVERKAWRENMKQPKPFAEMMAQTHDFKSHYTIQLTMAGWFPEGVEPPLWQPPPPTVWVKYKPGVGR